MKIYEWDAIREYRSFDYEKYPAEELAELYPERWEIETAYDEFKTHLRGGRVVLRSKTPELVQQEFYGFLLAHLCTRQLMHEAALAEEFLSECKASNVAGKTIEIIEAEECNRSREASIVYTSGTTASAKGVVLSQGNFCFIAHAVADYLELTKDDRCALMLPLCHTYGKSVLLSAFVAGATVVVLDNFNSRKLFLSRLSDGKCTVLSTTPYHLHVLMKSGSLSKLAPSSLRIITSSANKLSPAVVNGLLETMPGTQIFSMYGLTEATTRVCYVPPEILHVKKDSCGRPLYGVEIRIADEDGTPVPIGIAGEIQVRGPNVMKGYFGDDDLTKATIVNGWLNTGDIGHMDEDEFLYIDGRKKDIIKCMGERINPCEIEEVLMEHPDVDEAAVVGRQDSLMGEIIHAYVTALDPSLRPGELRDHCLARLSPVKVPYKYTIVENFQKTGTGKIQKNMLADT